MTAELLVPPYPLVPKEGNSNTGDLALTEGVCSEISVFTVVKYVALIIVGYKVSPLQSLPLNAAMGSVSTVLLKSSPSFILTSEPLQQLTHL